MHSLKSFSTSVTSVILPGSVVFFSWTLRDCPWDPHGNITCLRGPSSRGSLSGEGQQEEYAKGGGEKEMSNSVGFATAGMAMVTPRRWEKGGFARMNNIGDGSPIFTLW